MKNLAPNIYRQRLVVEGICENPITDSQIKEYLSKLSEKLDMKTLTKPVTHKSDKFGWAGWIHWESSGCHFYAWDKPFPFFSADIYTCKKFDDDTAVNFTKNFFKTIEISFNSI
ncbi:S-adenosylmethionine decarboxylase [Patescibacteria group bacterium]